MIELPSTLVQSENITCSYSKKNGKIEIPTIQFKGSINAPKISLADFAGFVPKLSGIKQRMMLAADFYGTGSSLNGDLHLLVDGGIKNYPADAAWYANVNQFSANHAAIASFVSTATGKEVPAILTRTGDVSMTGFVGGGSNKLAANVRVSTSLGSIRLAATGRVYNFDYNGYKYHDINIDASYRHKVVDGKIDIDDPNAQISASGLLNIAGKTPLLKANVAVGRFAPNALHLTPKWQSTAFAANIVCDIKGSNVNDAK